MDRLNRDEAHDVLAAEDALRTLSGMQLRFTGILSRWVNPDPAVRSQVVELLLSLPPDVSGPLLRALSSVHAADRHRLTEAEDERRRVRIVAEKIAHLVGFDSADLAGTGGLSSVKGLYDLVRRYRHRQAR